MYGFNFLYFRRADLAMKNSQLLLIGGAALAAYFLFFKKKETDSGIDYTAIAQKGITGNLGATADLIGAGVKTASDTQQALNDFPTMVAKSVLGAFGITPATFGVNAATPTAITSSQAAPYGSLTSSRNVNQIIGSGDYLNTALGYPAVSAGRTVEGALVLQGNSSNRITAQAQAEAPIRAAINSGATIYGFTPASGGSVVYSTNTPTNLPTVSTPRSTSTSNTGTALDTASRMARGLM